jgi:cobaltochelatase CobS
MDNIQIKLNTNIEDVIRIQVSKTLEAGKNELLAKPLIQMIKDEVESLRPTEIILPNVGVVSTLKGLKHKQFKTTLMITQVSRQCMLVGPAGTGKTTLAAQVAEALNLDFAAISCSSGMSEAHLTGRMLFNGDYVQAEFVKIYENGGVFLFDEIDAADPNTLLVINSALANGYINLVNRKDKPTAKRHKDCIIIVSGNSYGHGSDQYHGRNYLDAAFLDRFALSKIHVGYDEELERSFANTNSERVLVSDFKRYRSRIEKYELNRVVSTRAIIDAIKQYRAGFSREQITDRLFAGWSSDEKSKCRQNSDSPVSDYTTI